MSLQGIYPSERNRPWLTIVRLVCFAIILLAGGMFVAGIPYRYVELQQLCPQGQETQCFGVLLTSNQARDYAAMGLSLRARAVFILVYYILQALVNIALAALMVWRRPDNGFIVFLALAFVAFNTDSTTPALAEAHPVWRLPVNGLSQYGSFVFPIIFYLFPNGRFVPRWTRYVFIVWLFDALVLTFYKPARAFEELLGMVWIVIFVGSLVAQIYRYLRRSTPVERQQIKWIVLLLAFAAITIPINVIFGLFAQSHPTGSNFLLFDITNRTIGLFLGIGIPLVFVFAIFSYHLWDIDVIIRRTLVYGLLTAVLALVYFGCVVLLQRIFGGLTGQIGRSQGAIVVSTLAIAALFSPLRKRIQVAIDRRFYRRRFNAENTLQAFAMMMRDEVDLDRLSSHLITFIEETMQPESVSLWLRKPQTTRMTPDE